MIQIEELLGDFMNEIERNGIEIYNEFSLQHELGIFLRERLKPNEYKVEFERNIKYFNIHKAIKHEIDIVVYNDKERYAIELKFPQNGQYPEQMYSFIKDICFMENLKAGGFDGTYCLTMVKDKNYYSGKKNDGIYKYFRRNNIVLPPNKKISKPTGNIAGYLQLEKEYKIIWKSMLNDTSNELKYYIVIIK